MCKDGEDISDEMWRNVYRLAKNVSRGHKIIDMQFKTSHSITNILFTENRESCQSSMTSL